MLVVTATLSTLLVTASVPAGQEEERVIEKQAFGTEPVKIKDIKVNKKGIVVGKKFSAADDWLRGLSVTVENKTEKNVTHVSVQVVYARAENDVASQEAPLGDSITYGVSPFRKPTAPAQAQAIPPGGSVDLVLSEQTYNENDLILKRLKYTKSIKKIELTVEEVGFEDGTAWSKGQYWKPDPRNPGQWLRAKQDIGSVSPAGFFLKISHKARVKAQGNTCNKTAGPPF